MPTEEHRQRLAQLSQQQALITRGLVAMAEGRWVGEASVEAYHNVDRAMEPDIAAAILAEYFVRANVAEAAERCDWREVRRRVQGGSDGLDELLKVVGELGFG